LFSARAIKGITEPTHNLHTEPTTSSSYLPQENQNQEEEDIKKITPELESLLEALGVFEKLWPELVNYGWNNGQLLKLGYRLQSSNYANPGAIFVWRVRNQEPPTLASSDIDNDAAGNRDDFEDEYEEVADIPDDVISAWSQTLNRIRQEVPQSIYVNCVEPIQICNYNGSLELLLSNNWVKDKLLSLNLTPEVLSDYFSSFLGLPVPVQFVMS
jgi:hypothetical protein